MSKPTPQTFEEALQAWFRHAENYHACGACTVQYNLINAAHARELAEARAAAASAKASAVSTARAEARRETWREALDFIMAQPCPEWAGQTIIEEFERRAGGEK